MLAFQYEEETSTTGMTALSQPELSDEMAGVGWPVGELAPQSGASGSDLPAGQGGVARQKVDHPPGQRPSLLRGAGQGATEDIGTIRIAAEPASGTVL